MTANLTNGDKVVGEPLFSELKVTASFGRVDLAVAQLDKLTFMAMPKSTKPTK